MPKPTTKPTTKLTAPAEAPDGTQLLILSTDSRPNGLIIDELKLGSGEEAKAKSTITIHYHGTLTTGKVFDSTRGDQPATFPLNRLIQAWQEGIPGMKIGGIRRLTVPPELGYGEAGAGDDIPPNSTLVFSIELVKVK